MTKKITIGMFQTGGVRPTWKMPGREAEPNFTDLGYWTELAKKCEAGGADFLFLADSYGYPTLNGSIIPTSIERNVQFSTVDAQMLMSAMAAVTSTLGLVTTVSTTVEKPPIVTRQYRTLDHLTKGRIGWNIVTGSGQAGSALLFGEPLMPHGDRYAKADDHVELSLKYWEGSWQSDALIADSASGTWADPAKVHEIEHDGPHFSAKGVLVTPPSPQVTPTLFQAGASEAGRTLAAKYAEAVFLAAESKALAEQINDIRRRAEENGRGRDAVKCLIAGTFRVADTDEQARAEHEAQTEAVSLEHAATLYAYFTGIDLLSLDFDKPIPAAAANGDNGRTNVERFLGENAPTVREILTEFRANGVMGRPYLGTVESAVDQAVAMLEETGADGLLVQPEPDGSHDVFFEKVMPELRRRGLIADAPAGTTLREHLFGAGHKLLPDTHPGARFRR
ncbi:MULTISPECIES: NtaA/DmoA family FMN-dependent monooxygenase [Subtercola]|uniref:LLM class flavin-dependent oxidoreductase n=1 Tax=Subtercola vilae TaxID=2056433 RepID=A0A4V4RF60_9MICO|nr:MULTISPECIES: NtaA/DmoA family FMN-dependent monooxygenase [Subtercola]MEA9987219.1 NtaA/DmoA family FMN-dependent monooxygenase [Subtercola sp. RTI3]TIH36634.1 LLM class flavin-dependent oxidoreductase [Subtercola vilae]